MTFPLCRPLVSSTRSLWTTKIDAWLAEQCGLEVMAARRGIPQTDEAALGVQWDARFSVLCPQGWEQPPPSALMYTCGGGQ